MAEQDAYQRSMNRVARVAGATFLVSIILVILVNYGISFRLSVPGDAAATARNILGNETLFRINIAFDLIYGLLIMLLLTSLYLILKPVNHTVALLAAVCRLIVAIMWCSTALHMLVTLRFLGHAGYLSVFEGPQLQALARLQLSSGYDAYYTGLPFWCIASLLCSYLWLRSKYVPKMLALFGILASGWGVFCAFMFIVYPDFDQTVHAGWFDVPLVLFETVLGVWLLIKGLSPKGFASHPKEVY